MNTRRYYGKYRGVVTSTDQASRNGRLKVRIALGGNSSVDAIAEACVPYAGEGNGMYAIPPSGSGVWVEFQEGDLDKPIWSGCWWKDDGELPRALGAGIVLSALPVVLQSQGGHRLVLGGNSGNPVLIETERGEQGPRILMTDSSIKISFGQAASIEITPSQVKINGEGLVVT